MQTTSTFLDLKNAKVQLSHWSRFNKLYRLKKQFSLLAS